MKASLLFLTFFSLFISRVHAQSPVPTADDILKPALAKAAANNKKVILIFHASWCGWCRKMDSSLQDVTVRPFIDKNYDIVHLTVYESPNKKQLENPGALEFLKAHDGENKGLPFWYILDAKGNVLADSQLKPNENTGCPSTEEEVTYLTTVLKKTSSLNKEQLEAVHNRFRMNDH